MAALQSKPWRAASHTRLAQTGPGRQLLHYLVRRELPAGAR